VKKILPFLRSTWQNTDIRKHDTWLGSLVSLLLRIGTLFLIILTLLLVFRIFKEEGYSIEAFLVPEYLAKNGFDGNVMARQLQDEYSLVKSEVKSIKTESFQSISGSEQAEINISVMGFGISLRSIAFQLRELLGRKNNVIRCEITQADSSLAVTMRMTNYAAVTFISPRKLGERATLAYLHRKVCEQILKNSDPYRLSLYFQRKGKYDEGIEVARKMLSENPDERHWAKIALGSAYEETGQMPLALKEFEEAAELSPNFELAYLRLALHYQRTRKDSLALPYIEKVLAIKPDDVQHLGIYADLLNNRKRFDECDRTLEKIVKLAPNDPEWYSYWGGVKQKRGDKKAAKELFTTAISRSQKITERLLNEGYLALLEGDTALMVKKSRQMLDYEADNIKVLDFLLQYYWTKKQYREIVQMPRLPVSKMERKGAQNYYNYMAMTFNMLGERDSALANIKISIDINPKNPIPQTTLAEIYAMNGDDNGFYTTLEKAFVMGFNSVYLTNTDLPYSRFAGKKRYEDLLKKYRKEK
jgi:tetratricopeptide (TPR) repeat protein